MHKKHNLFFFSSRQSEANRPSAPSVMRIKFIWNYSIPKKKEKKKERKKKKEAKTLSNDEAGFPSCRYHRSLGFSFSPLLVLDLCLLGKLPATGSAPLVSHRTLWTGTNPLGCCC
jgi:hypothetical protein